MNLKLGHYELSAHLRALCAWSHFRIHRHEYYSHLVWGRLSVTYGRPGLTPVRVCAECSEEIQGLSAGDESWDYCERCHQVEGRTETITMAEFEARQ